MSAHRTLPTWIYPRWLVLYNCSFVIQKCCKTLPFPSTLVPNLISKSVIASKATFTYKEAQIRKDDPFVFVSAPPMFQTNYTYLYSSSHHQDDLTSSIRMLNALAQKLKAKRMAAGALNLALMSLVCSRCEQTKTNLYPGAFSPQQHRDHSEERARKYCETTRIETERENDN